MRETDERTTILKPAAHGQYVAPGFYFLSPDWERNPELELGG